VSKGGEAPLFNFLPLSFEEEGERGGEADKQSFNYAKIDNECGYLELLMIPIKLQLRNFMCYRDNVPPLSFEGIHTACISGDNGNGKSALIDAITWALWGKARARSDDDLIYLDDRVTEMEVEFDFAVGQQPYRIIRKHSKPRRRGGV